MSRFNCTSFTKPFNEILRTGNFPEQLKLPTITPVSIKNNPKCSIRRIKDI